MEKVLTENDVLKRTIAQIAEVKRIPEEGIKPESTLQELGMDSLDAMNLLFALEEEFDVSIPDTEAHAIRTVRDASDGVRRLLEAKNDQAGRIGA
jgi:acyl carrier protein